MEVRFEALKASYGDCFFVSIIDIDKDFEFTIMIDGGTSSTYSFKNKKGKMDAGSLKKKIVELKEQRKSIDLLIITHVDNDHIGGVLKWFEDDIPSPDFVKRIWMNEDVEISIDQGLENTSARAASLKNTILRHGLFIEDQWIKGKEERFNWGRIIMLAPTAVQHNKISKDIAAGLENAVYDRYDVDIQTILAEEYKCDGVSPENDASMALLLQINDGRNYVLLGDANIDTILCSLQGLNDFDNPIHCEWVKLSHHGSKNNFKPELIQIIDAENYIISTDGSRFGHPDKETIAWLVGKTNANLWFNYPERTEKMFTKKDKVDYPDLERRIKSM